MVGAMEGVRGVGVVGGVPAPPLPRRLGLEALERAVVAGVRRSWRAGAVARAARGALVAAAGLATGWDAAAGGSAGGVPPPAGPAVLPATGGGAAAGVAGLAAAGAGAEVAGWGVASGPVRGVRLAMGRARG